MKDGMRRERSRGALADSSITWLAVTWVETRIGSARRELVSDISSGEGRGCNMECRDYRERSTRGEEYYCLLPLYTIEPIIIIIITAPAHAPVPASARLTHCPRGRFPSLGPTHLNLSISAYSSSSLSTNIISPAEEEEEEEDDDDDDDDDEEEEEEAPSLPLLRLPDDDDDGTLLPPRLTETEASFQPAICLLPAVPPPLSDSSGLIRAKDEMSDVPSSATTAGPSAAIV